VAVLATAAFVVWAVRYSDFGKSSADVTVPGLPPPQASPIAVRLANAIGRASLGPSRRTVHMASIASFAWERVYVFANETSAEIARSLGFEWSGAPATVPRPGNREALLVFVRGREVAGSAFFSDAIGGLECLVAPAGYPRGTRFVVRFTRRKAPFLSTSRPDGAESRCLRFVGIQPGA
jgi:hypothetical protein